MTIDVHTHVVPAQLPFGVSGAHWPTLVVAGDTGDVLVDGQLFRTVRRTAWDLDARLTAMAERGSQAQVLSPMPHLFSYWAPLDEATDFAAGLNTWLAQAVAEHPGRYYALGTIPLQDPDAAARSLTEVKRLGLHGVEFGTNVNGVNLCDPRFSDVLAEAERLELAVFIHAFQPPAAKGLPRDVASAVCFPLDIAHTIASLIATGLLERHPRLRLCASHGGGALALALRRLAHVWRTKADVRERLTTDPLEIAQRLYYDILTFDADALSYVIDTMGVSQLVVGSDFPFLKIPPEWPLTELNLAPADAERIRVGNALRFLGEQR